VERKNVFVKGKKKRKEEEAVCRFLSNQRENESKGKKKEKKEKKRVCRQTPKGVYDLPTQCGEGKGKIKKEQQKTKD